MEFPLNLDRPLACFDIEATGVSPRADRIIDLAIVKIMPGGERETFIYRVNPERPIPAESTAIHGITDADVVDKPPFSEIAEEVHGVLEGCDLAGFNIVRYDVPMLAEEFLRCGIKLEIDNRRMIDAQRIFHQMEPRNLTAALSFYCNEMHLGAHGAIADVEATIRVLEAQCSHYSDLPRDPDQLDAYCNPRDPKWVDRAGRLRWEKRKITLNFGRKKGTPLADLIEGDPGFIKWMLRSDFPQDVRDIITEAMAGRWPEPPALAHGDTPPPSPQASS